MRIQLRILVTVLLISLTLAAGKGKARRTTTCGNGALDEGEECDDGNRVGADGCTAACKVLGTKWRCEQDAESGLSNCFKHCGDGKFQPEFGEECDDGNVKGGDGCSATCKKQEDWRCVGKKGTKQTCERWCGNGKLNLSRGEECDTGVWNKKGGPDGCSGKCKVLNGWHCNQEKGVSKCFKIADACGDGYLDTTIGEECDDGNEENGDGCTANCKINANWDCVEDEDNKSHCSKPEKPCGNGVLEEHLGEECDDGNRNKAGKGADGCNNACKVQNGWECDEDESGKSYCELIPKTCGNGIFEPELGEQCDDGNKKNGDGCNRLCKTNKNWICEENDDQLSLCWRVPKECGNGKRDKETEQCDDGNNVNLSLIHI